METTPRREAQSVLRGKNLAKRTRAMTTHWLFSNKYFFCPHSDLLSKRYMFPFFRLLHRPFGSSGHCLCAACSPASIDTAHKKRKERLGVVFEVRSIVPESFNAPISVAGALVLSPASIFFPQMITKTTLEWFIFMTIISRRSTLNEISLLDALEKIKWFFMLGGVKCRWSELETKKESF